MDARRGQQRRRCSSAMEALAVCVRGMGLLLRLQAFIEDQTTSRLLPVCLAVS